MVTRTAIGGRGTLTQQPADVEPGRGVLGVVVLTLALTPLVNPKGPGNSALVDLLMAGSIFVVFLWALRNRLAVRLPYWIPWTALMVTGLLSAMVSIAPSKGALAIVQEIFLLLWCAAVVTLCRTPRGLRVVIRAWAVSSVVWAGVLVLAVAGDVSFLLGTEPGEGGRVRLLFDHPNMAGAYFMTGVFVVAAAGYPRRAWLRSAAYGLLLLAMLLAGSNAALISLGGGVLLALFLHVRARSGMIKATAFTGVLLGALAVGWFQLGSPLLEAAQRSDNELLRYSVGRGERSAEGRVDLFESQLQVFEQRGNLLGIGPATTLITLDAEAAPIVKEAHSDYLGTLVERGPLGVLAMVGLMGAVAARLVGPTTRPLPRRLREVVPVPAALAGAAAAYALYAITHEALHYRWLWTLFAVIAAVHLLVLQGPGRARHTAPAGPGSPPPSTDVVPLRGR